MGTWPWRPWTWRWSWLVQLPAPGSWRGHHRDAAASSRRARPRRPMGTCPHRALHDGEVLLIQDDSTEVLGQRPPPRPAASCSDCRGYLPVGESWPGPVSVSQGSPTGRRSGLPLVIFIPKAGWGIGGSMGALSSCPWAVRAAGMWVAIFCRQRSDKAVRSQLSSWRRWRHACPHS